MIKHLAVVLAEQGRAREAVAVLSRAVALGVGGEDMEWKLALGLVQAAASRRIGGDDGIPMDRGNGSTPRESCMACSPSNPLLHAS